jgi:hypothetical protein
MIQEAIRKKIGKVRKHKIRDEDRERMTEKALAVIQKTGTAAALEKCRVLADKISAELSGKRPEHFVNTSSPEELLGSLERAAAVLKKQR